MAGNDIGDNGASALADALKVNNSLQALYLDSTIAFDISIHSVQGTRLLIEEQLLSLKL